MSKSPNSNHPTNSGYFETEYEHEYKHGERNAPTEFYNVDHEKEISITSQQHNEENNTGTKRGLDARHIQMISLGGAIGTGLFLNSGSNISDAGPAGALIAYCVSKVYCIMTCLGEMATYIPTSGSFNHYATRFVEPSYGFALGVNYCYRKIGIERKLAAAATIIDFWKPVMPNAAWSCIFLVCFVVINLMSVRIYGEMEYWFAMFKVIIVIVFIIVGILVAAGGLGGQKIGFSYWKDPGAFAAGGLGTVSVLLSAGFSFLGTEIVGITAGEAKNPTKTVPRAIRNTFWRILIFYIATIFLLGMCVPYTNPDLVSSDSSAATASFTLVFKLAGINAGAHVINAVTLTSVLSAANSSLYTASRTLLGLSLDGNLPAFISRTNRYGSPYIAVGISSLVGFICVFISIYSPNNAFVWFLHITTVSGFITWGSIGVVHVRFRRAFNRQGRDINELPYKSLAYPFSGIFAATLSFLIALTQGYTAFYPQWNTILFVTRYIGILPFVLCYVLHKIFRKSKVVPLEEADFDTNRVSQLDIEMEAEDDEAVPKWKKILHHFS
ncbi:hypothetical protein K501DRAFT_174970 [Backusella circina FSU 941]|nr:hypothetical protein K501DRAFT_174970 [Backusella circina FSU 941]